MSVVLAGSYTFDWSVVWDNQGILLRALKVTFELLKRNFPFRRIEGFHIGTEGICQSI